MKVKTASLFSIQTHRRRPPQRHRGQRRAVARAGAAGAHQGGAHVHDGADGEGKGRVHSGKVLFVLFFLMGEYSKHISVNQAIFTSLGKARHRKSVQFYGAERPDLEASQRDSSP